MDENTAAQKSIAGAVNKQPNLASERHHQKQATISISGGGHGGADKTALTTANKKG
jgi:hypothetical protein